MKQPPVADEARAGRSAQGDDPVLVVTDELIRVRVLRQDGVPAAVGCRAGDDVRAAVLKGPRVYM